MSDFYFDLTKITIEEAAEKIKETARTIEANPSQPLFILTEHVDMNGEALPYYAAFPYDRDSVDRLAEMINNPEKAWDIYRKSFSNIGSDVVARIARSKRPPKEQIEHPEAWYVSKLAIYNSADGERFRKEILKNTVFAEVVRNLPNFSETRHHHGIFNAKFNGKFKDEDANYEGKEAGFYHFWREIRDNLEKRREFCFRKQFVCDGLSPEEKEFLIQTPCSIYAFNQCGVNDQVLKEMMEQKMCYGNTIKTTDLKSLLFTRKYGLQIYSLNCKKQVGNTKYYPKDTEFTKIEVDVFQNHMMKHESHEITYIGSRNRKFTANVNFLQLLRWAFDEKFLVPMNCYEFAKVLESRAFINNYKAKTSEILEDLSDYDPAMDCELYSATNKRSPENVVFFDFECSTDELYHRPYSVSYKIGHHRIKHFFVENGKELGEEFLKALQKHFLPIKNTYKTPVCVAYAHNLKYDIQFLLKYLRKIPPPVTKGNKLYSIKGVYGTGKNKIMFEFRDTLPLLQMSLKKAGNAFLSEKQRKKIKKEAFPYQLYTFSFFEAHPSGWCTLEEFRNGFVDKKALEDFDNNLPNLNKKIYNPENQHIFYKEYCHFYCDQDVRVLYKVMKAFKKFMTDTSDTENPFGDKFSPFNYLSISSLAYDYMVKNAIMNYEVIKVIKHTPIYGWVPKYPIYNYSRLIRYIGQQTIRGGRVMTRGNQMAYYKADLNNPKSLLVDYDAVSLYPSAISKLWITEGTPKVIKGSFNEKDFLEKFTHPDAPEGEYKTYNDGWIHIHSLHCNKDRQFPQLCIKDEKTKLNDYKNFHGHVDAWVNAIDLFNLIEFQDAEFWWDAAFVWEGPRHYECREVITRLFQIKAHAANPMLRFLAKLMMNSIYGKSILKPTNHTTTIQDVHEWEFLGEDHIPKFHQRNKWREFFNANAYRIKEFTYHPQDKEHITVKLHQLDTGYTNVLFGSNVLAMARRIVSRVISLAEDMEELHPECSPGIFYTDTDSMHIRIDLLEYTEQAYMEKYGKPIKGVDMCQFHIDFDPLPGNEAVLGADESWFLAKKMYADHLIGVNGGEGYHQRMKGVPGDLIEWDHYKRLFNGETIEYNLLANGHVSFVIENGCVSSRLEMKRQIKVNEAIQLEKDFNTIQSLVEGLEAETRTPQLELPLTQEEPPPYQPPEWQEWMEGDTQPLDIIEDEDTLLTPAQKRDRGEDEINIETDDEEPVLKIAKID